MLHSIVLYSNGKKKRKSHWKFLFFFNLNHLLHEDINFPPTNFLKNAMKLVFTEQVLTVI